MLLDSRWRRLCFTLLALLPFGCGTVAPPEEPPPAVVEFTTASAIVLEEWTEFVGTTMPLPNRSARVSARVDGMVLSVLNNSASKPVIEGQEVSKGAVLAQLDTTVINNSLAEADATQEALVEEQKQAQFTADLAAREVTRLQDLSRAESGTSVPLVSAVEREKARVALLEAQSKLKAAGSRLTAGAKRLGALREQLQFHTLTSPIAGRLGRIQVVPGQSLAVGTVVADVIDVAEQIDVLCFVPPSVVGRLTVGQAARTGRAEEDSSSQALGELVFIADQAEPDTGNFAVKVRFANQDKHLRANSVVRFCLQLKPGKEAPSLPESAIQEDEVPPTVVLVTELTVKNKDNKDEIKFIARRMQVELGLRDRSRHQVEILSVTDPEKEPGKPKVLVVLKENQFLLDGKEAQFVSKGAPGLQTGDVIKLDAGDD